MTATCPEAKVQPGQSLHGFTVTAVTPLPQLRASAILARHDKSGAHLMHLLTDDPENLFAVAFRTPPPDDTGLPHILEHTVLCGSKKYPVKDPFVELLKTSMATFLNAMTYPDKTVYPCASMNEKDFFNLVGVYCDAAFHPLITENHFQQEGHHLDFAEPGNPESDLIVKGIVYNEMKGAYSDLDGVISREESKSVCPDNAYGLDSGGDPDAIPSLTYEQFVQFHKTYYHPTNSLIFIHGCIPTDKHLAFLDREYLSKFSQIEIDTNIGEQPRWSAPLRKTIPYPVGPQDSTEKKTAVVATWLACDIRDATRSLAMNVLDYTLLGNAASPLRKALIDSKLGEELTDSGYADYQRDTFFTVGLKGTEAEREKEIVDLIRSTCKTLADDGLDKEKLAAAFHRLELSACEIQSMYPLRLMDRVFNSWLYDGDPLHYLRIREHLADLRQKFETEPGFFESMLREMIVDNPHYSVLTFVPDSQYLANQEKAFAGRMRQVKSALSKGDLERVAESAKALDAMQSAPNTPEALATLPRLALSDVPPEPLPLATSASEIAGRPVLVTDEFSNGLNYIKIAFDLNGLDEDLLDWIPLYGEALRKMGAAGLDYAAMAEREAMVTGGVGVGLSTSGLADDPAFVRPIMTLSSKALDHNLEAMLGVLHDRLFTPDFTDRERLRDIILQGKIHRHSNLVPSGHRYAASHAARHLSKNAALHDRLLGIEQIRFFDRIADSIDEKTDQAIETLERIHHALLARGRITVSLLGSGAETMKTWCGGMMEAMRDETPPPASSEFTPRTYVREGVATPADVAFVAKALPSVAATDPRAPALLLLGQQLSYGYLWNEIRVKNGAYGAHASFNAGTGIFAFTSYRDPCIGKTLASYAGAFDHVAREMDRSREATEQAIIGTVKSLDKPIRPSDAVSVALSRHLEGHTEERRKEFRQKLLGLSGEMLAQTMEQLRSIYDGAPTCVVSSREKLEAANAELGDAALMIENL